MESRRKGYLCAGAVMTLAIFCTLSGGRPPVTVPMKGAALRHHGPVRIRQQRADGSYESDNWSGYAVTNSKGSVSNARAEWVVPSANCFGNSNGATSGYSAFWTGIDGFNSNSVEQVGTDSDCVSPNGAPNSATYYAWFEFYPQPAFYIGNPSNNFDEYPVKPGDLMLADISSADGNVRGTRFTVTITNQTRGWNFNATATVPPALQTSAEWIAEAPASGSTGNILPLANFGLVDFTNATATVGGVTGTIGSFGTNVQNITMVTQGTPTLIKAQPSALSADGSGFTVAWLHPGP